MPTIYDEIKSQFDEKLNESKVKNTIDSENLNKEILDLSVGVLLKQVKSLRKKNFEETPNIVGTDANEIIRTIDQEIDKNL